MTATGKAGPLGYVIVRTKSNADGVVIHRTLTNSLLHATRAIAHEYLLPSFVTEHGTRVVYTVEPVGTPAHARPAEPAL